MSTKVLSFIGKGQITIPQEWRAVLGMEYKAVKATLYGDKIIIEPLSLNDEKEWDIDVVSLNSLPKADQDLVKEGRKFYKNGKSDKFLTAPEFFKT